MGMARSTFLQIPSFRIERNHGVTPPNPVVARQGSASNHMWPLIFSQSMVILGVLRRLKNSLLLKRHIRYETKQTRRHARPKSRLSGTLEFLYSLFERGPSVVELKDFAFACGGNYRYD